MDKIRFCLVQFNFIDFGQLNNMKRLQNNKEFNNYQQHLDAM